MLNENFLYKMYENRFSDSESTWDMYEEDTLINYTGEPSKVDEDVRREVAQLFRTPSFMREVAQELMLLNPLLESSSDNKYVKIEDLREIVGNLISRNVVGHSLAVLEDDNKHFGSTIRHMAEDFLQLTERVNHLAYALQTIAQNREASGDYEDKKYQLRCSPTRVIAGAHSTTPLACKAKQDISKSDKLRTYNDLIRKYHNQKDASSNDLSIDSNNASNTTAIEEPQAEVKAEQLRHLPSQQSSKCPTESLQQLYNEYDRRAAERRQFEMNMLMYRKSQFSLQLNNHNENLSYSLWARRHTTESYNKPHKL